jgi:hypothetical protein
MRLDEVNAEHVPLMCGCQKGRVEVEGPLMLLSFFLCTTLFPRFWPMSEFEVDFPVFSIVRQYYQIDSIRKRVEFERSLS